MSNTIADVYADCRDDVMDHGREAVVYDAIHAYISPRNAVRRFLPHRARRMVGAWCFVDVYGPDRIAADEGMAVPPHPHTGLQTLSWLVEGTVLHRDSLGSTALVRPGQAALMTAGHGIAHSENSPPDHPPVLHGAQLWIALPDVVRDGPPAFALHEAGPTLPAGDLVATVFMGRLAAAVSSGQAATPLVGAELRGAHRAATEQVDIRQDSTGTVPLEAAFEHLVVPLSGQVTVDGHRLATDQAIYLGTQRSELAVSLSAGGRALLLGGSPFEEELVMWWNFVGRSHEEIELARRQWNGHDDRFGEVRHYPGPQRLAAPELPTVRLRPRGRAGSS